MTTLKNKYKVAQRYASTIRPAMVLLHGGQVKSVERVGDRVIICTAWGTTSYDKNYRLSVYSNL